MKRELGRIFGNRASFDKLDFLVYASDASMLEGKALAIVWSKSREEIVKLVKISGEREWNVVPRGGGTGLAGGSVPKNSIIIDLSMMNKIRGFDKKGRDVYAESGVVLDDLNFFLEDKGLVFPLMPSSHKAATIGGMIATDAAGNRALKYGRMQDWVSEIEIVNGKGEAIILKGKGLKEFCGTEGILGIIIKAKLKLTEKMKKRSVSMCTFGDIEALIGKSKELLGSRNITALEFFDKLTARLSGLEEKYHLFAEFESLEGEIKDEKGIMKIWNMREAAGPVLSKNGYIIMEDPLIPLDRLLEFAKWMESNGIPYFGHLGMGIIHQRFQANQTSKIKEMYRLVQKLGGKVSGEHGVGLSKKKFLDKAEIYRLRKLKKKYDPLNIINRGKMI